MTEINPEAIVDEHKRSEHVGALTGRSFCESEEHERSTYWPCDKHVMAARLLAVRGYAEALADARPPESFLQSNDVAADLFALLEGRPSPLEQQAARLAVVPDPEPEHVHNPWEIVQFGKGSPPRRYCLGCGEDLP